MAKHAKPRQNSVLAHDRIAPYVVTQTAARVMATSLPLPQHSNEFAEDAAAEPRTHAAGDASFDR